MNYLLDLDKNKDKYKECKVEFVVSYQDVFKMEDKEFGYDGLAMYINTRVFKDFDFVAHEEVDLAVFRISHRIGLKSK